MVSRGLSRRRGSAGLSLVELLVAMAIGLVLTLAIATVLTTSEGSKRTATSVNDVSQTAAYTTYVLDRALRSAGSGYAQRWTEVFGCRINASLNGAQILPRTSAFPAPFSAMPLDVRLAPFLVVKGAGATDSDTLVVISGTAGFGESAPRPRPGSITLNDLRLLNTWGMRGRDLVLVAQTNVAGCILEEVTAGFVGSTAQQLPFSGPYYTGVGADVTLTSFGLGSYAILMGNAADNPPQATMYGVDANGVLMSYDMLRLGAAGDSPVALAEGVVQMRALYGIDDSGPTGPNPDGIIDRWVDPGVAPYDRATLMDGSVASRTRLRHITAVRLGLILRTSLVEVDTKDIDKRVAAADISLFGDIPALKQTRVLTDDERRMRHRTVEVTIPLRNLLLAPPK